MLLSLSENCEEFAFANTATSPKRNYWRVAAKMRRLSVTFSFSVNRETGMFTSALLARLYCQLPLNICFVSGPNFCYYRTSCQKIKCQLFLSFSISGPIREISSPMLHLCICWQSGAPALLLTLAYFAGHRADCFYAVVQLAFHHRFPSILHTLVRFSCRKRFFDSTLSDRWTISSRTDSPSRFQLLLK